MIPNEKRRKLIMLIIESVKTIEKRKEQYAKIMRAAGANWKDVLAFETMPIKSMPSIETSLIKISVNGENVVVEINDQYEEQILDVVADNAELILSTAKTFFVALKSMLKSITAIQKRWEEKTTKEMEENKTEEKFAAWMKTWHPFQ